jgi:hypothetical protein
MSFNWQVQCLAKDLSFSRPRTFLWPHFDPINHQKAIFCYCSSSRWNNLNKDDLDDEFSSYICNFLSKTLYSACLFNDLIQIVWFLLSLSFSSSSNIHKVWCSSIIKCSSDLMLIDDWILIKFDVHRWWNKNIIWMSNIDSWRILQY